MNEQEEKARQDLSTADEVLKEASAKLEKVHETKPMSISAVAAVQKMIDTARDMRDDAMEKLDEIRMKQKSLHKTGQTVGPSPTIETLCSRGKKRRTFKRLF